jgi:hypothetical protein
MRRASLDTYSHLFEERDPAAMKDPAAAIEAARREFDVRDVYAEAEGAQPAIEADSASRGEALFRTRTGDPLLTMEMVILRACSNQCLKLAIGVVYERSVVVLVVARP